MSNHRKARGMRTQLLVTEYLKARGWPHATSAGAGRSGVDVLNTPDIAVEEVESADIAWENESAPEERANAPRGLTHSSDLSREGLAMQATRRPIDPATLTENVMRRIWAKTTITPTGCIEWTGATSPNGYGRIGFGGGSKTAVVHRLVLVWATGADVPPGHDVDHLCRNRACIRPDHLEAVTRRENIRRGIGTGSDTVRLAEVSGICKRGHDLTAPDAWRDKGNGRMCRLCDNENARRRRQDPRAAERQREAVRRYRSKRKAVAA